MADALCKGCSVTSSIAGMYAPKAFRDVSCVLTWLGMLLMSCGVDMRMLAKLPAALLFQQGRAAQSGRWPAVAALVAPPAGLQGCRVLSRACMASFAVRSSCLAAASFPAVL